MKLSVSKKLGFTLVELLVVIAIIGILSSVAVVNLGSARNKAKIAAMQETLASLRPVVLLCFSNEEELLCGGNPVGDICDDTAAPEPGQGYALCTGTDTLWPDINAKYPDWSYCFADSSVVSGTYSFAVTNGGQADCSLGTEIHCDQSTCEVIQH